MKKVITAFTVLVVAFMIIFPSTPSGVQVLNNWGFSLQKADDATNYNTRKAVEDTCRAMIASYKTDTLTYEQYKDEKDSEKQSWGEQAKMRANKTATSYNEYILKNSFIWQGNVPSDILQKLETIS